MTDEDNVVKSSDVAKNTPTSFNDLKKEELVTAAQHFGVDDEGNVKTLKASLAADGVTWEMYAKAFGLADVSEVLSYEVEETEGVKGNVENDSEVVTADPHPKLAVEDKYLIKMTRANPYFEFGKYKFTQEHPYAIMPANDAQAILETEEGFRQAFPAELQEYYG